MSFQHEPGFLSLRHYTVFKGKVMRMANALVRGTAAEDRFKNGEIKQHWYNRFLERQGLTTGNQRPLEIKRDEWTTSTNVAKHYDILADTCVRAGIARWNPNFDPTVKDSEMIYFTHPERLISFDETRLQMDMTAVSKSQKLRTVGRCKLDPA